MNTIHSSSLAWYRTGYIKPEADRFDKNSLKTVETDAASSKNQQTVARPASTPEQIKTALAKADLINNSYNQPENSRAAKALMAYTETRNQPIQTQLSNSFTSVDIFV